MRTIALGLFGAVIISLACRSTTSDQWQPIQNVPGGLRRNLVSEPRYAGPFKYQIKVPARSRVGAHHHTKDVHVKVLSGAIFIIIGEPLEASRAQHFTAGSNFTVPANTLHEEWWDEESVLEAEGVGPMETVYKKGADQISFLRVTRRSSASLRLTAFGYKFTAEPQRGAEFALRNLRLEHHRRFTDPSTLVVAHIDRKIRDKPVVLVARNQRDEK